MRILFPAALAVIGFGGPARAHIVASRLGDFYGGALHPLSGLPDAVLWLALGMLAATQTARWTRWLVIVFPAGLLAGFALGLTLGWTRDSMLLDAALMALLGGLVAAAIRVPGPMLLGLAFGLSAFRGAANASGVEAGTDATLFAAGLTAAGYAAITLTASLFSNAGPGGSGWRSIAIRAGGSWIAAIGLMVGSYSLVR